MKADMLAVAAAAGRSAVGPALLPVVPIPLNFQFGANQKITTLLRAPGADHTIDVVYDLGSSNFWLFRPNATMNWGRNCLACQGKCNVTVPEAFIYDPSVSRSASPVGAWDAFYPYGSGLYKGYRANGIVDDTFTFTNDHGDTTTVPKVQVALAWYLQQRILDRDGTCLPVPDYSHSIMGLSPFYSSSDPSQVTATKGPSFRTNLQRQGMVSNKVQSMWFEQAPVELNGTYTGIGLQGGIDTTKYKGSLVKVPSVNASAIGYGAVGYYTPPPNVTFVGGGKDPVAIPLQPSVPQDGEQAENCMIDSGGVSDGIAAEDEDEFLHVTGLAKNMKRWTPGAALSWPAPCDTVPADPEAPFLRYGFAGVDAEEKLDIAMPLRSYVREQLPEDEAMGWCTVRIYLGSCLLASPFLTRTFFAADDEVLGLALAQGGVAKRGSGVDNSKVVGTIP